MSKPWEQEWDSGPIVEPQWAVFVIGGEYVANTLARDDEQKAKFIAAAPDMARALVALRDSGINSRTWDDAAGKVVDVRNMADEALRKAGVIP